MRSCGACLLSVVWLAVVVGCSSEGMKADSGGSGSGGAAGASGSGSGGAAAGAGAGGTAGGAGTQGGTAGGGSGGLAGAASADPALRWLGRVEPTAQGSRFSWPGSGFEARFTGTGAKVSVSTGGIADYFQVVLDGGQSTVLETTPGTHEYTLADGLAPGEHHILFSRRTESFAGTISVGPVTFTGGQLLAPGPAPSKRMEIVGDSISAGYGVDCTANTQPFSYPTENHFLTYGARAARELEADLITLAWSGIGMYRSVNGETTEQMPVLYGRTIATEADSVWDFSRFTPDVVLVHLGTNDFAKGDPGQPFVEAYKAFVTAVRGRYAAARIYLAVSPMLAGGSRTALESYLEQVRVAQSSAGDDNVAIIAFSPPTSEEGWGCDWHPSAATQATMGTLLVETLRSDLGW